MGVFQFSLQLPSIFYYIHAFLGSSEESFGKETASKGHIQNFQKVTKIALKVSCNVVEVQVLPKRLLWRNQKMNSFGAKRLGI